MILFVGEDYNQGNPPLGADTVRVVKVDYDNQKIDAVTFPADQQTLNGSLAAEYNRAVAPGGDLARSRRQNLFMQALQDKMISAKILPKVPDLVQEFDKMTVTDLSPKQLANLACMATRVPKASITFNQIEGDLVTSGANGAMIPNVDQIKAKLKEWLDL